MIEIHKKIHDIFKNSTFDFRIDKVVFQYSNSVEVGLRTLGIEFENIRNESIEVEKRNFPLNIYIDHISYLKLHEVAKPDVLILNVDNVPYSFIEENTYINFTLNIDNFFFTNAKSYSEFLIFLKEQDKDTDEAFHFIDYYNSTNRKIVFTSLTDKGRLIIKFFNEIYHFDEKIDLSKHFDQFKNCFSEENHHLPKFLKNSIIDFASRYDSENRIYKLYEELNIITNKAKINFEIYLNNLSIDKIRKDYDEYKSKYFKEVSDILSNLTQKIIGLPLLVATTLFAVEKVKDNYEFLYVIIAVTVITSIYLVSLLKINFNDLNYVDKLSNADFEVLNENKFFINYPQEINIFLEIKERIVGRIKYLKYICQSYFWILSISNILTLAFILNYLKVEMKIIFIFSFILIFLVALLRNNILSRNDG